MSRVALSILLSLTALPISASAQSAADDEQVVVRGMAQLTADFYDLSSEPFATIRPRRPASLVRLHFTPSIRYRDFHLPITLVISSNETNVTTPRARDQSFTQFLQNPMNRVNMSPEYRWARLDLGTYTPRYSDLTTGNQPVFGAGFDLTPGPVRVTAFTGTSQRAIQPDSTAGVTGSFARRQTSGRIAFGSDRATTFGINAIYAVDDTLSIVPQGRGGLVPTEGLTASADVVVHISDEVRLSGEIAGSSYSRNLRSDVADDFEAVSSLMTVRESTRLDYGVLGEFNYDEQEYGGTILFRYLGDGFVPVGFPYAQTDLVEVSVAPRVRFLENRLIVNGSLGYRVNNLQNTSLATSNQIVGMLNATGRINESLTISGNYSNFGFQSSLDVDTLKIRTISQNFGITPSLTVRSSSATHNATLSLNLSDFTEENTLTSTSSVNNMIALVGTYSIAMQDIPFTGSTSASFINNNLALGTLTVLSASIGGSYRFFEGAVSPSLRLGFSQNGIGDASPDKQFRVEAGVGWQVVERLTLQTTGQVTRHMYGDLRPGAAYTELQLRSGLSTRF